MRLPRADELIEYAAGAVVSAGLGYAFGWKIGVASFAIYVGLVLGSISYQMQN